MFEHPRARSHGDGGVPEWAFTGAVRREAARLLQDDPELGALGRRLRELPGGPRLVDVLGDGLRAGPPHPGGASEGERASGGGGEDWSALDDVDAGTGVEVVAAFERVAAWARAGAARAAAALAERPETRPQWPAQSGVVAEHCTASTDLSLRLGITRHAARTLLETGRALDGPLQQTGAALRNGVISWEKARLLAERLEEVPLAVSVEVEAAVLPIAAVLTPPQLSRATERALQRVDHRDAAERHARARLGRQVGRPRSLPNGMAAITAVLPAEAAVRLDACLQAAAVSARAGGDGRTTDQLRADALDAMARSAWEAGWIGSRPVGVVPSQNADEAAGSHADRPMPSTGRDGAGDGMRLAQDAGRGTLISVTVGLGTLLGLDDRPGELAGYGPIGADVARLLATEGTWRRLVVDEPGGALLDVDRRRYKPPPGIVEHVRQRNRTCVFPTCSVPAAACQLDHTVPFPHGPTAADNLRPVCASHHQMKTHAGYRLEQPAPGSFVVRTRTGHVYLQGPDGQPGVPSPDDVSPDWADGPCGADAGTGAATDVDHLSPPPDDEPPF